MGFINFLIISIRIDLAFLSNMLLMFNTKPIKRYLSIAMGILRYIKYTLDYSIKFAALIP